MLLGIPPMDGMPRIGFGLEVIGGSGNIGHILTKEGYDSVFVKASKRNSHYMDVIAKSVGFQKYFGQEDIKQLIEYPDYSATIPPRRLRRAYQRREAEPWRRRRRIRCRGNVRKGLSGCGIRALPLRAELEPPPSCGRYKGGNSIKNRIAGKRV